MSATERTTQIRSGAAENGKGLTIILVISDDRCISELVGHFRQRIMGTITVVTNVDKGMQAVFEKKPSAVFLQSEMGGVTGDVVAHHIKNILGDSSPRFILLRDSSHGSHVGQTPYDGSIDLTLGREDLLLEIEKALRSVLHVNFRDSVPAEVLPNRDERQAVTSNEAGNGAPLPSKDQNPTARRQVVMPDTPQSMTKEPSNPEAIQAGYIVGLVKENDTAKRSNKISKGLMFLFGVSLLTLAVSLSYSYRSMLPNGFKVGSSLFWSNKTTAIGGEGVPSPPRLKVSKLPSVIPLDKPDRNYASTHPGWERYHADGLEFRIYRETGSLKAVQVLAIGKQSIGEGYFQSLLRDLSGANKPGKVTKAVNGGYLQESGVCGDGIEFIVYRRKAGGEIRAIVVSMP